MPLKFRSDPYAGYKFEVAFTGLTEDNAEVKGMFSEVSGLDVEVAPVEYRSGKDPNYMRKNYGLAKFSNIVLKRGVVGDLSFWKWIETAINGQIKEVSGSITLKDENGQDVMQWQFEKAWPCKHSGPSLNAKNNEVAIESVEICHQRLKIATS